MDKLIDDIIELILGDVDCYHDVDHDEDGIHTSVEYNLNNETKLRGMIKELIQKPEITKEWIEEKAIVLTTKMPLWVNYKVRKDWAKDFIRSLYEEMPAKKATVDEEFVERWADKLDGIAQQGLIIDIDLLKQMLREVGVEVKK